MAFYMIKLISKFLKKGELNNSIDAKSDCKENSQVNSAQLYSTSFFYALFYLLTKISMLAKFISLALFKLFLKI